MSKNAKIVLVVVILVLIVGIWWWASSMSAPQYQAVSNATAPTAAQNNSDQSINQNMANVDAQMNGLSSDTASVDQGLNDQSVPQQQL